MNVATLHTNADDMALVQRLYDLSNAPGAWQDELTQLDALVYGRMAVTYGLEAEASQRIAA